MGPSPRPDLTSTWPPRAVTVKGGRRPSRSNLPLTVTSTAAGCVGRVRAFLRCGKRRQFRGEFAISDADRAPQPCIRSIREDRNHDAVIRISGELRGGGPILHSGLKAMGLAAGHRHLGSSSADPGMGRQGGCPSLRSVAHDAGRKTTPCGTSPVVTRRHRAMSSLRASATIIVLRVLPRPSAVRT